MKPAYVEAAEEMAVKKVYCTCYFTDMMEDKVN